jgi:hypothetical protein
MEDNYSKQILKNVSPVIQFHVKKKNKLSCSRSMFLGFEPRPLKNLRNSVEPHMHCPAVKLAPDVKLSVICANAFSNSSLP